MRNLFENQANRQILNFVRRQIAVNAARNIAKCQCSAFRKMRTFSALFSYYASLLPEQASNPAMISVA
jgi:hypothetical protein